MSVYRTNVWRQVEVSWHAQEQRKQDKAYIELNNLYLNIERCTTRLDIHTANHLRVLAGQAYPHGDPMLDYWLEQFMRLEGWVNT